MIYADIIVPLAVEGVYTYAVPPSIQERVTEGVLVLVSFAAEKQYTGLVVHVHKNKPAGYEIKDIEAVVEEQIKFSSIHLKFLRWMADYYMTSYGEVMKAALPVILRLESYTSLALSDNAIDYTSLNDNERALLNFLRPDEYVSLKDIIKYLKLRNGMSVVRTLLTKKYIKVKETVDELFREKKIRYVSWYRNFTEEEKSGILDSLKRAAAQYKLLCTWIEMDVPEVEQSVILTRSSCSSQILKVLCDKRILRVQEKTVSRFEHLDYGEKLNDLSEKQTKALQDIRRSFIEKDCVLLKGVTSSGKTEIYIHLIKEYLAKGKQVLYMLPEIALTVQIVKRLRLAFGDRIGIYHSGMSDQMRAELWKKQCSDRPFQLILGVRSSIFLPYNNLGLVVIDEEHDSSYKQKEPAPRYNGRDAAIMLAKMHGAKVLLGTATPSFESYHNALTHKYGFVEISSRFGGVSMPQIEFADLKECRRKKLMHGSFSPVLLDEMKKVLAEKKQVILFQNRRGYSSYVQCNKCGAIPKCPHCDVSLTYYKSRDLLVCRYCGALIPLKSICTECGEGSYQVRTPGTEKIEEEIADIFPEATVARMDLDVISSKTRFRQIIDDFENGKIDVLVGTQMVSKGLDFDKVKLVGVMDADHMISFPDFRAEERAYQMLMQVSGRCGRREEQGKVIIQASDLKNHVYELLIDGSYEKFYEQLSGERKFFGYPPFGRIIQIELRHRKEVVLRNSANELAGILRKSLHNRVCGPAVPPVGRIGDVFRLVILLKIDPTTSFSAVKKMLYDQFRKLKGNTDFKSLKIFCDVDP